MTFFITLVKTESAHNPKSTMTISRDSVFQENKEPKKNTRIPKKQNEQTLIEYRLWAGFKR